MKINKFSLLTTTITSLTISPLLIMVSCSSPSYSIIIPKILPDKILGIENEINAITLPNPIQEWMKQRETWEKEQWLTFNNPNGYISGGNVFPENIQDIKVSIVDGNKINFFIELDQNSLYRFNDHSVNHNIIVEPKITNNTF